ncbi:MAG: hypothetical protein HY791_10435 [Deltaproteobacteria bacterium]|nr:hypothetical protein [Deltaproteobacteria bacterium]
MSFWLFLTSATVAIAVESTSTVRREETKEILAKLSGALASRDLDVLPIDAAGPGGQCSESQASECARSALLGTRADAAVVVRIAGGLRSIAIVAERFPRLSQTPNVSERELPRDGSETWSQRLSELAFALFPEVTPKLVVFDEDQREQGAPRSIVPVLGAVGAGTLAIVFGIAFGVASSAEREDLEAGPRHGAEFLDMASRMETYGLAANVLGAVGVLAVVTGVGLLLIE